jgi:broad specificity phosphatase PhoE
LLLNEFTKSWNKEQPEFETDEEMYRRMKIVRERLNQYAIDFYLKENRPPTIAIVSHSHVIKNALNMQWPDNC